MMKKRKFNLFLLTSLLLISCQVVYNKKMVLNMNRIGEKARPIRIDGYYYQEKEDTAYPYVKNQYGGYSADSTKPYLQKQIMPLVLFKDGGLINFGLKTGLQENFVFNYSANCGLSDSNSFENAKIFFECDLKYYKVRSSRWGKGVFRTDSNGITIQYYVNHMGNYYLVEKKGKIVSDTSFVLTKRFDYFPAKEKEINEHYKFCQYNIRPDSTNYIIKHKRRFKGKA